MINDRVIQFTDGNDRGIPAWFQGTQLSIIDFFRLSRQVNAGNI
jgi:hypothetical protein